MERVRLLADHRPPQRPALVVSTGDRLAIGDLSEEWPAFRRCIKRNDSGGWIPDRYLSHLSTGEALALRSYDTTELAAVERQTVSVIEADDESGWLWCRADAGHEGWIPIRSVVPVA